MFVLDKILAIPEFDRDHVQCGISGGERAALRDRGFVRKDGIKAKDYMIRTIKKTDAAKAKAEKAIIKGDKKMQVKSKSASLQGARLIDKDAISRIMVLGNGDKSNNAWAQRTGLIDGNGGLTEQGKLIKEYDPYLDSEISLWAMHTDLVLGAKDDKDGWSWFANEFLPARPTFKKSTLVNAAQSHFNKENVSGYVSKILDTYTGQNGLRRLNLLKADSKDSFSTGDTRLPSAETMAYVLSRIVDRDFKEHGSTIITDKLTNKLSAVFGVSNSTAEDILDMLSGSGYIEQYKTVPPFQTIPRWNSSSTSLLAKAFKKEFT